MNSTLVFGTVKHVRVTPVHDELGYTLWRYVLDVDELGQLDKELPLFGYNRFAPVSIYDRDYLDRRPGSTWIRLRPVATLPPALPRSVHVAHIGPTSTLLPGISPHPTGLSAVIGSPLSAGRRRRPVIAVTSRRGV